MDTFFSLLVKPVEYIINLISTNPGINQLVSNYPIVGQINHLFYICLTSYLRYLAVFLLFRFMLLWFPNVNPYTTPYIYIQIITSPYERFFEENIPLLFGMNWGFFILISLVGKLISVLEKHPF